MMNVHQHRCADCGFVWEHPDCCAGDNASHTCPRCGQHAYSSGARRFGLEATITFLGPHAYDPQRAEQWQVVVPSTE